MRARNGARGLLAVMAAFVSAGGLGMWLAPEEGCTRWAALRGLAPSTIECTGYSGEHAVAELYGFSLSKHHTMLGLLFFYFAIFGRSREAIDLGFAYLALAMLLDSVPVFTWIAPLVSVSPAPIGVAGLVFLMLSALGIRTNSRHPEWSARGSGAGEPSGV